LCTLPGQALLILRFSSLSILHPPSTSILSSEMAVLMVMMPPAAVSQQLLCIAATTLRIRDFCPTRKTSFALVALF